MVCVGDFTGIAPLRRRYWVHIWMCFTANTIDAAALSGQNFTFRQNNKDLRNDGLQYSTLMLLSGD